MSSLRLNIKNLHNALLEAWGLLFEFIPVQTARRWYLTGSVVDASDSTKCPGSLAISEVCSVTGNRALDWVAEKLGVDRESARAKIARLVLLHEDACTAEVAEGAVPVSSSSVCYPGASVVPGEMDDTDYEVMRALGVRAQDALYLRAFNLRLSVDPLDYFSRRVPEEVEVFVGGKGESELHAQVALTGDFTVGEMWLMRNMRVGFRLRDKPARVSRRFQQAA